MNITITIPAWDHTFDPSSVNTIEALRRHYRLVCGGYWFDPDTMRAFGSKLYDESIFQTEGGWLFVSSELDFRNTDRRYTVRRMSHDGDITNVGELRQYATLAAARKAAQRVVVPRK